MVAVPDPLQRVLTRVEDADQPRPADPRYGTADDTVPVAEPCEACGCRWVTDPEAVIPEGTVECGFCGVWRGSLHRDASLSEYADGDRAARTPDETIEYRWAESPFLGWDDIREYAHLLVLVEPDRAWTDAFAALASRCPYERHLYLQGLNDEVSSNNRTIN